MQYFENKVLSEEEKSKLLENRYIKGVSSQRVQYTKEFHALALDEKLRGKTAHDILVSVGIDPEILGQGRVASMNSNLNTRARECREQGISDPVLLRKNRELEELRRRVLELENRLREECSEKEELFNRAGYYEAECRAIKKK